jgi:hypothetical protein
MDEMTIDKTKRIRDRFSQGARARPTCVLHLRSLSASSVAAMVSEGLLGLERAPLRLCCVCVEAFARSSLAVRPAGLVSSPQHKQRQQRQRPIPCQNEWRSVRAVSIDRWAAALADFLARTHASTPRSIERLASSRRIAVVPNTKKNDRYRVRALVCGAVVDQSKLDRSIDRSIDRLALGIEMSLRAPRWPAHLIFSAPPQNTPSPLLRIQVVVVVK